MESPRSRKERLRAEVAARQARHGAAPSPLKVANRSLESRPAWASPTKRQLESPAEHTQRIAAEVKERTCRELLASSSKLSSLLEKNSFAHKIPEETAAGTKISQNFVPAVTSIKSDDSGVATFGEPLPLHLGAIVEICCRSQGIREECQGQIDMNLRRGEIRFIGEAHFGVGLWVGIELLNSDDDAGPMHDGSVDGVSYFKAARGLFVRPSDVTKIIEVPNASHKDASRITLDSSKSSSTTVSTAAPSTVTSDLCDTDDLSGKKVANENVIDGDVQDEDGDREKQNNTSSSSNSSSDSSTRPHSSSATDRTWAFGESLDLALEQQYTPGKNGRPPVDPDAIFQFDLGKSGESGDGVVSTVCDLSAIFQRNSISYTKRYSTGQWSQDGLSVEEELVYKRGMGFLTDEDSEVFLTSSPDRGKPQSTRLV